MVVKRILAKQKLPKYCFYFQLSLTRLCYLKGAVVLLSSTRFHKTQKINEKNKVKEFEMSRFIN